MHRSVRWEINHVRFATCHVFNQDLCLTSPRSRATPTCVCAVYISMKLNSARFKARTRLALNALDYGEFVLTRISLREECIGVESESDWQNKDIEYCIK
jgi:hypothetical protein